MSLIVGRVDNGNIILLGDSKLTYKSRDSNPYLEGCLKLYIVNPQLALGFAGVVEHFEQVLPHLLTSTKAAALIETAQNLKKMKNLDFDLIVAQAGEDSLYVLKGDHVSHSIVAHIGDENSFEAYQKSYFSSESGVQAQVDRA